MARDEAWMRRLAEHYRDLRRKYSRAARHPWLSVELDPPGPGRPGQ